MRAPSDAPRVVATYVSKKPYVTSEARRGSRTFAASRESSVWFAVARDLSTEDERGLMLPIGTTLERGSNTTMGYRPTTAGARSEVAVGAV